MGKNRSWEDRLDALVQFFLIQETEWDPLLSFGQPIKSPGSLLGEDRARDMIVNVAIPSYFGWMILSKDTNICLQLRELAIHLPSLQNNRRIKNAVRQ